MDRHFFLMSSSQTTTLPTWSFLLWDQQLHVLQWKCSVVVAVWILWLVSLQYINECFRFSSVQVYATCHWSTTISTVFRLTLGACATWSTWRWQATSYRTSRYHTLWHSAGGCKRCCLTTICWMHFPASCFVCRHWAPYIGTAITITSSRRSCGTTRTSTSVFCVCKVALSFRRPHHRHCTAHDHCSSGPQRRLPGPRSTSSRRRWLHPVCVTTSRKCTATSMSAAIATKLSLLIYQVRDQECMWILWL